jgi:hypothetical protein
MKNRRQYPRISTSQEVDLYLYSRNNDSLPTGRVAAMLLDLSKQGAGLKFSQVFIDGRHLCYTALDSETVFIAIVFRPTDDDPEKIITRLARPVWFDRDMEDSAMPFRMGVQFVDLTPPVVPSRLV